MLKARSKERIFRVFLSGSGSDKRILSGERSAGNGVEEEQGPESEDE